MGAELDDQITQAKKLIQQREEIERQLAELFGGATFFLKLPRVCSKCRQPGHTARTCTATKISADSSKGV